jgi:hypothetical protein
VNDDRTVHAVLADGGEVVRYDRAGKWFLEYPYTRMIAARRLSLKQAVQHATSPDATVHLGRRGGTRFRAEVWRALNDGAA